MNRLKEKITSSFRRITPIEIECSPFGVPGCSAKRCLVVAKMWPMIVVVSLPAGVRAQIMFDGQKRCFSVRPMFVTNNNPSHCIDTSVGT